MKTYNKCERIWQTMNKCEHIKYYKKVRTTMNKYMKQYENTWTNILKNEKLWNNYSKMMKQIINIYIYIYIYMTTYEKQYEKIGQPY